MKRLTLLKDGYIEWEITDSPAESSTWQSDQDEEFLEVVEYLYHLWSLTHINKAEED